MPEVVAERRNLFVRCIGGCPPRCLLESLGRVRARRERIEHGAIRILGFSPGIVVRPERPRLGTLQHERPRAVWIRRGKEDAHGPAFRHAVDGGALRAGGIHDGAHVVHSDFEWSPGVGGVGHPGPALVEVDQPRERRDALVQRAKERDVPRDLDVRRRPGNEYDVERPLTCDSIGDVDVAAACVANFGDHPHSLSQGLSLSEPQFLVGTPIDSRAECLKVNGPFGLPAPTRSEFDSQTCPLRTGSDPVRKGHRPVVFERGLTPYERVTGRAIRHVTLSGGLRAPITAVALVAASLASSAPAGELRIVRPNLRLTPGAFNPAVRQTTIDSTICVSGWTREVRPPESYTEQLKQIRISRKRSATNVRGGSLHSARARWRAARSSQPLARAARAGEALGSARVSSQARGLRRRDHARTWTRRDPRLQGHARLSPASL